MASRQRLSERVAGVICDVGVEAAVAATCANDNAEIDEPAMTRALQRFSHSRPVTSALARRKTLRSPFPRS